MEPIRHPGDVPVFDRIVMKVVAMNVEIPVTTYYLMPLYENNSRNRAKTPSPCVRKVEMSA